MPTTRDVPVVPVLRPAGSVRSRVEACLARIPDPAVRADLRERFEERAGIIEFDGDLPRDEAERLAYEEIAQRAVRV